MTFASSFVYMVQAGTCLMEMRTVLKYSVYNKMPLLNCIDPWFDIMQVGDFTECLLWDNGLDNVICICGMLQINCFSCSLN